MSFVAYHPEKFIGKSIGTGQCVAFVEAAANHIPYTGLWKQGKKVRHNLAIKKGTAIATFQFGQYSNYIDGSSHAAIYLEQTPNGLYVLDQWIHNNTKQAVHKRLIKFKGGIGKPANDGDAYYIIEHRGFLNAKIVK